MEQAAVRLIDHHTHVFSARAREWFERAIGKPVPPLTVDELMEVLDRDGVDKAAVLSVAYFFARPGELGAQAALDLRAENDGVAQAVRRFPDRLVGFFGINPLSEFCLDEIDRCAARGGFVGIKLHLANSRLDLLDPAHTDRLATAFERANSHGLAILVHLRTMRAEFGAEDIEAFIDRVLSCAPDVMVQVAHAAGWGGYDAATDAALAAFARRLPKDDALRRRVVFDLSAVVRRVRVDGDRPDAWPSWYPDHRYERLVSNLRLIGLDRVLFGTDWPEWTPRSYEADLRCELPLDPAELRAVFANRAQWLL